MRSILAAIAITCFALTGVWAEIGQTALLVKVSGFDGGDSYRVMSMAESKALEKRIRDESRYLRKALANAKKIWEADKNHEKIAFPTGAVKARKLRATGRYKNSAEAQEKLQVYEDRLAQAELKDEEKEKERTQRSLKRVRSKEAKAKMMEKIKEEELKDAEKNALREEALELFEAELEKLMPSAAPQEE